MKTTTNPRNDHLGFEFNEPYMANTAKKYIQYPFVEFLLKKEIIPKIENEIALQIYSEVYKLIIIRNLKFTNKCCTIGIVLVVLGIIGMIISQII